jgi:small subunit ribosomal protein S8
VKSGGIEDWEKRFLPSREVGLLIMSSPGEIISQRDAKDRKVGGRLLAYVY